MKVKELIEKLQQFDPDLPVSSVREEYYDVVDFVEIYEIGDDGFSVYDDEPDYEDKYKEKHVCLS